MRWRVAQESKIVRRAHQPRTKVMLPQSIDDDARSKGIPFVGDPLCQLQPSLRSL